MQAALRYIPNTAPPGVTRFKQLVKECERLRISLRADHPVILIFDLRLTGNNLPGEHQHPCKTSSGSKPVTTHGTLNASTSGR